MIVIEGMDNTGKSCLLTGLCEEYGLEGIHSPGPKDYDTVISWVIEAFNKDRGIPIIYDRFPLISEAIYGPALRNRNIFNESPLGLKLQERFRCEVHPLIIFCNPSAEIVQKWNDRDQMAGVIENYKKLMDSYVALMSSLRPHYSIVSYDYSISNDMGKVLEKVDSHMQWWIRERFDRSVVAYRSPGPNRYFDIIKRFGGEGFI
jgi:hypothetical protein